MSQEEDIKKILKKLEDIEGRLQKLEKPAGEERKEEEPKRGKPEQAVKKLAEKINVSEEEVWKVFDVEEDRLTLINIIGKNHKEKTKNAALLVLLGYKYFFGKKNVLSQEIKRNVADNRIPVNGYSTYIKELTPTFISKKGKPGSKITTCRLTTFGEAEAREVLKKICKG